MRKFLMIMATIVAMCVNAQTLEPTRLIDNSYIRVSGGATALMHPGCNNYENWGHTVQAVIGAEIGKWITPNFGVAFAGDFGIRNGSRFGKFNYETTGNKAQHFNYITVSGLVKGNVTNILGGYKVRPVELVLATGPMWIHGYPGKNYVNDFGVKFQGELNINLNKKVQLNIIPELNYNLTSNANGNHPRFDSRNAWYGLQVGFTYKVGNEFTACPYKYTQAQVDELNAEINRLRNQEPKVIKERVIDRVLVDNTDVFYVFFTKNSAVLNDEAKATLNKVSGTVSVIGGASEDGSLRRNNELATERADAVANYLRNRGINVVSAKGAGVTGSRVAIITKE